MTYRDFLKRIAGYDGNWDDEVIFVNCLDKQPFDFEGHVAYKISSIGIEDGKCIINNLYDE